MPDNCRAGFAGTTKISWLVIGPQRPAPDGAGDHVDPVDIDLHAKDAPRLAVEGDGAGRPAGTRPANRIKLADQPPGSELADQIRHGGNAESAATSDVVAATCSMVADVAKDLGEVSVP